jgi:ATP-dependent helicase HrpA
VLDLAADLFKRLPECMLLDQHELRHRLRIAQQMIRQGKPADRSLTQIAERVEASVRWRQRRATNVPTPTYPADLPVVQRREDIAKAIRDNQVVVLCGETGSGKTTQLPKICLELGRGVAGMIGHTQPRRIAARSVAVRVAEELGTQMGRFVGYKVRFGDETSDQTYVKLMTDGILLAETQGDRDLYQYDTLIIDEAHERSLNIDFLLGYIRQLLPRRPDLKVIITSATINPRQFSEHFNDAPVIEVSGRVYPVEVRYHAPVVEVLPDGDYEDEDQGIEHALIRAVDEIAREPGEIGSGDILVFLSGEREIREAAEDLRKHHPPNTEIIPLYARLTAAEQMKVFEKHDKRRIVLSTNIAETSLTVPGIRSVIDTGLVRMSRYSARTKVQRLPIEPISKASADQRKGRCGRVGPGLCIRLYSEEDFSARADFTEPEILRTNLASVILQMKSLRLGEPEHFPFVEPPDSRMIADGVDTLVELGAIEPETSKRPGELTPLGRDLAKLPIDPRVGRMILGATRENCLREVLIIAAALSVQDPRERPLDKQNAADEAHARYRDETSDFVAYLNLWKFFHEQQEKLSASRLRKFCHQNFLSFIRMREWIDIHRQLRELLLDSGHHENQRKATPDQIHRALLTGLLTNIGRKGENYEFNGVRGGKFSVFPGSGLFDKPPQWIMAAEIVQTTRRYARTCAKIDPRWVEELAAHLLKHTYSDPHWSADAGQVAAYQTISLFGLEIAKNRRIHYGPIDPAKSREIFIHHALVEGQMLTTGDFFLHNHNLEKEIKSLEIKGRRADLLADFETLYRFYDARIPPDVFNVATFENWRREAERKDRSLLFMKREDILVGDASQITPQNFPDRVHVAGAELPISYKFDPGAENDGVTLNVPLEALLQIEESQSGWLVPGLIHAKVAAMVRALPKNVRRTIDAPDELARRIVPLLKQGEGSLEDQVLAQIQALSGQEFARDVWSGEAIPLHLRMHYRVLDQEGRPITAGQHLGLLRAQLGEQATTAFQHLAARLFNRENITDWDFGDLPETQTICRGPAEFRGYPALADAGRTAALRLYDTPAAAALSHRRGLLRLFMLRGETDLRHAGKGLPAFDQMAMWFSTLGPASELRDQLVELIAERIFLGDRPNVRTRDEFTRRLEGSWGKLGAAREQVCREVHQILQGYQAIIYRLSQAAPAIQRPAMDDVAEHLRALMNRGFLTITPGNWLAQYPRYIAAIASRLNKLQGPGIAKDEELRARLRPLWHQLITRATSHARQGLLDPELVTYRWMLEEYRVSLFAQDLRTIIPVSEKRLAEQWSRVRP